jgi:acetoin utilization deacetylase AcuC-like enzyme
MIDLNRKLEVDFKVVESEISIQKAFELLADPGISILIYITRNQKEFYYLTEGIIKRALQIKHQTTQASVDSVAIKSMVFDFNRYQNENLEYLVFFKKALKRYGQVKPEKILVMKNGKPIGLISDLVFQDVPDEMPAEMKSDLDLFLDFEPEPKKNLDKFYDILLDRGFKVTGDVKLYMEGVLMDKLQARENPGNAAQNQVPELEVESKTQDSKALKSIITKSKDGGKGLVVVYNPSHVTHRPKGASPEVPERLTKIMDILKRREKIFNDYCRLISDYPPATEEDILMVHSKKYLNFIKYYSSNGGGFLGDSTYITKTSHDLALLAVGGAFRAADDVLAGKAEFGLALIRPPGHHASKDKYGGYCIYNNSAILARHLQSKYGLKKIMILDWDAHAANGTQDIFFDDPSVMLVSLHQDPHNFYPKTGFMSQMGSGKGIGYNVNVEMPRGSGDDEYITVLNEIVIPLMDKFKPDFLIGCNGFDAHHSDQFTELQVTAKGYYRICQTIKERMPNRAVILMEGGYNPSMGDLTLSMVCGLLGVPNPINDSHLALVQKVVSEEKIHMILKEKLKELKFNLKRYQVL